MNKAELEQRIHAVCRMRRLSLHTERMIDFDDIKSRHRIEDFLASRNIEVKRASGGFTCKCPFHDGDNKASLFIHGSKQYAKCWTRCEYIGSIIDVVMALDGVDKFRACEILEGKPLTELEQANRPRPQKQQKLCFERRECRELPRMFRAEQLKEPPQHYFELIGRARSLHYNAIELAHNAGCLRFCQARWRDDGEAFNCYAILDVDNPLNVQFRRLDTDANGKALCFWRDAKVMGWKGNTGSWPVGIDVALLNPASTILLVEGTGDFLAAWDIRSQGYDVVPVAMFGASNSIHPRALPFFERRQVVIVQQHDLACQLAAERWTSQLAGVHANVRTWIVPEEGADLNDYVSSGGDANLIFRVSSTATQTTTSK